jgi:hypothetical protein
MSYTVIINGVPVQCESAADAIELTRQAATEGFDSAQPANRAGALGNSRWTEQRVKGFYREITAPQRKFVDTLLDTDDPLTDEQLFQKLGHSDGRALGGVISGLMRNAKKVGADPNDLYKRRSVVIGDRQGYEYELTEAFRSAAKQFKP